MTKLDELKIEQVAIETKLSNYVAAWKTSDSVFRRLNAEHAQLVKRVQEEQEKALDAIDIVLRGREWSQIWEI